MTDKERDDMIRETHAAVLGMKPKVDDHHKTLYGDGSDGNPGLKTDFAILKRQHNSCTTCSMDGRKLTLATVMMILTIIGLIANVALGYMNLKKGSAQLTQTQGAKP